MIRFSTRLDFTIIIYYVFAAVLYYIQPRYRRVG